MPLAGVAVEERGAAFHQLVKNALVFVAAGADPQPHRFLAGVVAGGQGLPLAQSLLTRPGGQLVGHKQHRVVTVGAFVGEWEFLNRGVEFLDEKIVFPTLRDPGERRFVIHSELERRIDQIALAQLRSYAVDFGSELAGHIAEIGDIAGRDQGFAHLAADDPDDLLKLADLLLGIQNAIHQGQASFLPEIQLQVARCQDTLVVVAVFLNEIDRVVAALLAVQIGVVLDAVEDFFVKQLYPFADDDRSVLDALVVFQDVVHVRNAEKSSSGSTGASSLSMSFSCFMMLEWFLSNFRNRSAAGRVRS